MKVGVVIEETWAFFNEIYKELQAHHPTSLYARPKVNGRLFRQRRQRYAFNKSLKNFFSANDVVFFEWTSELLTLASRTSKTCGVVARLHRYEMNRWVDQIEWDWVDRLIVVSQAKRREFVERFPDHAHKLVVIPEAISLERFTPISRPYQGDIGILCNLTPRKRVYELILAFDALLKQRPMFRLHIGGGEHVMFKDYYRSLYALVGMLGLQEKVIFYGHVKDAQAWYGNIDVFISNSYSEGLQVSPMEAIASGRYCLSHLWEGADELLSPESLFLTQDELVNKLLAFDDLSAAGRQEQLDCQQSIVRERFDVNKIKVQVRELVEEVGAARR